MLVGRLALALFWFNPFAWLLVAELARQTELAADEEAVRHVARAGYAQTLLAVAGGCGAHAACRTPPAPAGGGGRRPRAPRAPHAPRLRPTRARPGPAPRPARPPPRRPGATPHRRRPTAPPAPAA
ncbi:M56 family metallopeptidase, partial [Staphylococcus aureus]|uniref:M56 family metallopeptidase n=1 Tax=Staphylococcus aureus TaxID=1280 RepID=UPI0039C649B0